MLFLRKIAIFALRITGRRVGDGPGEMPEWSIGPHSKCGVRATVPGVRIPLSPQYTLSVKGLRKVYTKMYTKRPEFSQFGAFLCLKCRVHSCTPVYMKKPRHKAGAHCSPMQLWGFATMWCKGSEDFTESFLSLQESSLSN